MRQASGSVPIYDSANRGLPAIEELRELFNYRELVFQTVRRNIVVRYKRSILGVAWTMLNPLGTALILTFVFSAAFGAGSNYAVYVLSGLVAWNFFAQTTNDAMLNLLWGGSLIKRIYMPKTVFGVSSTGTGLINLTLALVPLLIIMLITRVPIQVSILFLPYPILLIAMFTLGISLLISACAMFFPDIAEMYNILLTAWFYLTPVIWVEDMLPQQFAWLVKLNPMFYLINLFRVPIIEGGLPTINQILFTSGIAFFTLFAGWLFFSWKSDEFAYRV